MNEMLTGVYVMGYAIAGLFFLKFWKQTRDRLFAIFAAAFWILGLQRLALGVTTETTENVTYLYVIRLLAFVLILVAILDKNMQAARKQKR